MVLIPSVVGTLQTQEQYDYWFDPNLAKSFVSILDEVSAHPEGLSLEQARDLAGKKISMKSYYNRTAVEVLLRCFTICNNGKYTIGCFKSGRGYMSIDGENFVKVEE